MKLLKIESGKGWFLKGTDYELIDKLGKDELLQLVNSSLEGGCDFDEYNEDALKNQAHQIVYKRIHEKLVELNGRAEEFKDESERLFLSDYQRYMEEKKENASTSDDSSPGSD